LSLGEWPVIDKLRDLGCEINVFNGKRVSLKTIKQIGLYLTKNDFNLLVSQGTVANAYARAISLIYKIPNLVTVHSTQSGDYSNLAVRAAFGLVEFTTRFPTAGYIAVSKFLKDQMVKSGISDKKISVIYNGLDFPWAKPRAHKRLILGSVGRLHPVKGYDLLIESFAKLRNERLRLRIAGAGEELGKLQALAFEMGVEKRVEFVGYQPDIYKFLDSVDVYIQSSKSEGFGLAVVEAMSQGIPVVVTPAGSLMEIVEDKKTGYICPEFCVNTLAKTIALAVENYEDSKQIGENAKEFVLKNFEVKKWAKKTIEKYLEFCK